MTPERLKELADAHGADPRRWPADARVALDSMRAAQPVAVERALFEAAQLDAAMDASRPPLVSAALRDRVIASALAAGLTPKRVKVWAGRLAWFSGAGWAAAACAGVMFGINLSAEVTADQQIEAALSQSALDGVDDLEVLG